MSEIEKGITVDRRVQRTRQLLKEALIELIIEDGYNSITVQNIIDRANIGRSTFYAHYKDKEDLLLSGMEEVVHSLISNVEHIPEGEADSNKGKQLLTALPIFRHAREHFELYKAMVGRRGIDLVITSIQEHLSYHIQERVERMTPEWKNPAAGPPVIANFLAGSLLTLLTWWLDNDMPYSPERMDEMFRELAMPGVWDVMTEVPGKN